MTYIFISFLGHKMFYVPLGFFLCWLIAFSFAFKKVHLDTQLLFSVIMNRNVQYDKQDIKLKLEN